MNLFSTIVDWLANVLYSLAAWHRSTYQCSRPSHIFMYALVAMWIALTIALVLFYRRKFPSKPQTVSIQP